MCELEDRRYLGSEMIVSRPKSARRAHPVWSISTLALAGRFSEMEEAFVEKKNPPP